MLPVTYSHLLITLLITCCLVHANDHKAKLPVRLSKPAAVVVASEDLKADSSNEEILQISESVIDATYQQAKDLISERRKRENLAGKYQLQKQFHKRFHHRFIGRKLFTKESLWIKTNWSIWPVVGYFLDCLSTCWMGEQLDEDFPLETFHSYISDFSEFTEAMPLLDSKKDSKKF